MDITELRRVGTAHAAAEARERELAERLYALVVDALRAGLRPGDVAKLAQLSSAQVRVVARRAGLEPARRGPNVRAA